MLKLIFLSAVWLTVNITIGYVVAPVLFSLLDKVQAGQVMSVLLNGLYFFDLAIILFILFGLMLTQACRMKREMWLVITAIMVAVNQWFISPKMEWLKIHDMTGHVMQLSFAQWHGISQLVFLLTLVCFALWAYAYSKQLFLKGSVKV
ncbi:DUF4149 domain-containing protein [Hydrogenovibrio kuenenii]|uniref:DUF4149 domain-containing protein n=1 Tax=Hydrogenovibrio kuenenii TaxID=63658 RepID=UPI0004673155|nr:DUF4149 domain-containing protein [Hydrogenovibrio kuenenii]